MSTDIFTSDDEVVAIGRGLLDRTLPKAEWTHRAHFASAVWILMCRPDLDVDTVLPPTIRAYNESTGRRKYRGRRLSRNDYQSIDSRGARLHAASCG